MYFNKNQKRADGLLCYHIVMRFNPREFDKGFYWHFSENSPSGFRKWPGADGLTRAEREGTEFPDIFFDDYLPMSRDAVIKGNAWIYKNRHQLPEDVQDLNLARLQMIVSSNPEGTQLNWALRNDRDGPRIGAGRVSYRSGYWQTTMAKLVLQGFGIYPAIIGVLQNLVGNISSSQSLSPGAHKAWQRAGGVFADNEYRLETRHNPSGNAYISQKLTGEEFLRRMEQQDLDGKHGRGLGTNDPMPWDVVVNFAIQEAPAGELPFYLIKNLPLKWLLMGHMPENPELIQEYAALETPIPPIFVRFSAFSLEKDPHVRPLISNGNHRAAAALCRGEPTIDAYVMSADWPNFVAKGFDRLEPRQRNPDSQIRELQRHAEAGDREAAIALINQLVRARQPHAIYEAMQYLDNEEDQTWAANQYWIARGIRDPHWWHVQVVPYESYAVWATTSERAQELLREAGVNRAISYGPIWMDPKSLEHFEEDYVIGKTKRRRNPPQRPLHFYHVSLTRNEPRILREGLFPQIGPRATELEETRPAIYLFGREEDMHNALMNWFGEELPEDEAITGYRITLPLDFPIQPTFDDGGASWEWSTSQPISPDYIDVIYREPACRN